MARQLRTVKQSEIDTLKQSKAFIHQARQYAYRAGADQLVKKLDSAENSADGAIRHAERCLSTQTRLYGENARREARDMLKRRFPWLGTDETVECTDAVSEMSSLYEELGGVHNG